MKIYIVYGYRDEQSVDIGFRENEDEAIELVKKAESLVLPFDEYGEEIPVFDCVGYHVMEQYKDYFANTSDPLGSP